MLGDVLMEVSKLVLGCFEALVGVFMGNFDVNMGHWDSLLGRDLKHLPSAVLSRLHCKKKE